MARATIIVQVWSMASGWCYKTGYPSECEGMALDRAKALEGKGTPVRVYERTPEGPKVIYETPRS